MPTHAVAWLLAALVLGACVSVQVDTDYDPKVDFARYRTFAMLPPQSTTTGDVRLDNPLLHERIHNALASVLEERGYRKASGGKADFSDFRVGYHLSVEQKLDVAVIDRTYGYSPRWGVMGAPETVAMPYDEGTLVIDVVDTRSDKLAWRAVGSQRLRGRDPTDERVREVVAEVLGAFPPGGASSAGGGYSP